MQVPLKFVIWSSHNKESLVAHAHLFAYTYGFIDPVYFMLFLVSASWYEAKENWLQGALIAI